MKHSRAATVATRVFEPEGTAAAYRLGALVRGLDADGFTTTVLTTKSPEEKKSTRRIKRWPVLRNRTGAVRGYLQYASFDIPLFFRLLFGPRADIVIVEPPPTTGVVARIACWLKRTPYIYFSADVSTTAAQSIGTHRFIVAGVRKLERWALRGATAVLAVSEGVEKEVVSLGADPRSVAMIGTGIDTDLFSGDGPQADVDYPYLIYAGTMSEMQGAHIFVDAFAKISTQHPTARLKFFGQGVEAATIEARARELGVDRVEFLGQVTGAELAPWLRGAHAALASSRPRQDYKFAFSTKGLVSLSCGTPVIYAGNGPLSALIKTNSLGWGTQWEVNEIAETMNLALRTAPDVALRQHASRWTAAHHSLNAVATRAVDAINASLIIPADR